MTDKEEYGLEDVCTALDAIETQLKRIVELMKIDLRHRALMPSSMAEVGNV